MLPRQPQQESEKTLSEVPDQQRHCQQSIDLFRAFFRTTPSMLTAVLPNSILYSLQDAGVDEATHPTKLKRAPNSQDQGSVASAGTKLPHHSILNQHFKANGIEYIPESQKFRFLASSIAENPLERAPLNNDTLKRATKLIQENAENERTRRRNISEANKIRLQKNAEKKDKKQKNKGKSETNN